MTGKLPAIKYMKYKKVFTIFSVNFRNFNLLVISIVQTSQNISKLCILIHSTSVNY